MLVKSNQFFDVTLYDCVTVIYVLVGQSVYDCNVCFVKAC